MDMEVLGGTAGRINIKEGFFGPYDEEGSPSILSPAKCASLRIKCNDGCCCCCSCEELDCGSGAVAGVAAAVAGVDKDNKDTSC